MSADISQQLRALNLYVLTETNTVDSEGQYGGKIEEFHPPGLEILTAPHHAGAMDAPILLDMGMESPTGRIVVNGYYGQLFEQFGLANANKVIWQVKGGLEDFHGGVKNITWDMSGSVINMPMGRIRGRGEVPKTMLEIACTYYKISIDGTSHIEIDILNYIRRIGSVDRLAALRAAIGL